jgi:hypothetical protein
MMPQKDGAQMVGTITETLVEVVVEARRRKRRKVKTRIESLDLGTIQSDFATAEPTHLNSPQRNAALGTRAIVATIYGNTSRKESRKTSALLTEDAQFGRYMAHAMQGGSAVLFRAIRKKSSKKTAERSWS